MSAFVTRSRPCQAAWATAARAVTRSARRPSTSKAAQTCAMSSSSSSPSSTAVTRCWAAASRAAYRLLRVRPGRRERVRVRVVRHPATHDLGPQRRVLRGGDLDREPEPVEQLRAQLALLGVHRADEHQPGRVRDRDALALHGRPPGRRGVQQQVDQVVVEEVDLVDVEETAVGGGQQAGRVDDVAGTQRLPQVEGADHPVLGGAHRQLHQPCFPGGRHERVMGAVGAGGVGVGGVAAEAAPLDHGDGGQHRGERPYGRGLRGALLPADQHPADLRRHRGQHQGEREVLGADDGGEGKRARRSGSGHVWVKTLLRVSSPASCGCAAQQTS